LKSDEIVDFFTGLPSSFSVLKFFNLKLLPVFNFQEPVTM